MPHDFVFVINTENSPELNFDFGASHYVAHSLFIRLYNAMLKRLSTYLSNNLVVILRI